jgi:nitrogen regulatory protein PII
MKSVFIVFNQSHQDRVEYILDLLEIRGFTLLPEVEGRGSIDGEPRRGTHTWPEMNVAILAVMDESKIDLLFEKLSMLNELNREVGLRAFVWHVERTL